MKNPIAVSERTAQIESSNIRVLSRLIDCPARSASRLGKAVGKVLFRAPCHDAVASEKKFSIVLEARNVQTGELENTISISTKNAEYHLARSKRKGTL
eukprot:1694488-Rhodomonas_salina.1